MKIVRLKALNINSFKGRIEIDFNHFLNDNSLFAITGPTGAGKSTILDIITCALYGRTPRLKNPNELMAKHTSECFCEVEFEIKGHLYRSSWSQKRARKDAYGKFQIAKMEFADVESSQVIKSTLRDVPKQIEKLSGLDFERFIQSMMLAQGGFSAFLKAKESQRSLLLEKLTGTQIYTQISQAIYSTYSTLKSELQSDKKVLESIERPEEEALLEKKEALNASKSQKIALDKEVKELMKRASLLLEREKNQKEYHKKQGELEKLIKAKDKIEFSLQKQTTLLSSTKQELQVLKKINNKAREAYNTLHLLSVDDILIEEQLRTELKAIEQLRLKIELHRELIAQKREHTSKIKHHKAKNLLLKRTIMVKQALIESLTRERELSLLIKKYEEDREKLVEGEECFLCGSKSHPFIEKHIKVDIDQTALALQLREKELRTIEKEFITTNEKIKTSQLFLEKIEIQLKDINFSLQSSTQQSLEQKSLILEVKLSSIMARREQKDRLLEERESAEQHYRTKELIFLQQERVLVQTMAKKEQLREDKKRYQTQLFLLKKRMAEPLDKQTSLTEIKKNLEKLHREINSLQKNIGAKEEILKREVQQKARYQKELLKIEQKEEQYKIWVKLNEMVGSADGNKFSKYAQGITLEHLISLANHHLKFLSVRYEIQRATTSKQLLAIEVIDGFQGDIIRPIDTLSGGESFIISLALALGLSELASQKITIDSLFLDEGFGTLDGESLEIALNALSLLQSRGKVIGVISHIEVLKERIPLQINVIPRGDGTSFLEMKR